MSRFNATSPGTQTTNLAGGSAFGQSPELELISILITSFAQDQFYRTANDTFARIKDLLQRVDPVFAAKAAIYTRTKFGMRSISHVVASELAKRLSGHPLAKSFYDKVIYRPDDMCEIMAYHSTTNGKYPKAMLKGFASAFDRFDKYTLAKYRGEDKVVKLVDVVNVCHPVATEQNAEALKALVRGDLKSFDTWESELSSAGQVAENEEQKTQLKKEAWIRLIMERKIGYFALLRNLRNIAQQALEVLPEALEMLKDERLIKKSLVLPFRFLTATTEIQKLNGILPAKEIRSVIVALGDAIEISLSNVPQFDGETLVVLDVSTSMTQNQMGNKSPHIIGALFAAAIIKSNDADFMTFDGDARYLPVNPRDSLITIAQNIGFLGGSTNFHSIFNRANKAYDRIIILSDMQGWVGKHNPTSTFQEYKRKTGADPKIFSFDLQNYGSMMFPEKNVFALAGFSEKAFDIMKMLEEDKLAMINEVKKIDL